LSAEVPGDLWISHLAGLCGMILLALPVLRLDQMGARLARLERLAPAAADDPRWHDLHQDLVSGLSRRRQSWSPLNRVCLWSGYALLFGSQAFRLWSG
jgi:hypothetical protein